MPSLPPFLARAVRRRPPSIHSPKSPAGGAATSSPQPPPSAAGAANAQSTSPDDAPTVVSSAVRIALAVLAMYSTAALIGHYIIDYAPCEGPSMHPTLPSTLSYTIYSRRHRHGRNLRVGDLVIFESPVFRRELACKRILGMPGDYVVCDAHMAQTVGGAGLQHAQASDETTATRDEPTMVQVPEGHMWVAGDNMAYSRDSRFYGPVPLALVAGKALYNGDGWFNWTNVGVPQLQRVEEVD